MEKSSVHVFEVEYRYNKERGTVFQSGAIEVMLNDFFNFVLVVVSSCHQEKVRVFRGCYLDQVQS